jgi:hypothetical protein
MDELGLLSSYGGNLFMSNLMENLLWQL